MSEKNGSCAGKARPGRWAILLSGALRGCLQPDSPHKVATEAGADGQQIALSGVDRLAIPASLRKLGVVNSMAWWPSSASRPSGATSDHGCPHSSAEGVLATHAPPMETPMRSMFRTSVPGGSVALHRAKPVPETPASKSTSDSRSPPAAAPAAAAMYEPQLDYYKSVGYDSSSRAADGATLAASEAIAVRPSIAAATTETPRFPLAAGPRQLLAGSLTNGGL